MEECDWEINFITEGEDGIFIVWDETRANKIGEYSTREAAMKALQAYAQTLDYQE